MLWTCPEREIDEIEGSMAIRSSLRVFAKSYAVVILPDNFSDERLGGCGGTKEVELAFVARRWRLCYLEAELPVQLEQIRIPCVKNVNLGSNRASQDDCVTTLKLISNGQICSLVGYLPIELHENKSSVADPIASAGYALVPNVSRQLIASNPAVSGKFGDDKCGERQLVLSLDG